ncbi:phytanoyl-CoA dioxygenase [Parvularcula flava]|uniref:Phytanoyl-CoA dioxygenase n=1 Tax=Aquisalinus luteolus TaxID=1566827 RepID=A0A8J3A160_9PROT|nr:phytanoyl-CoA dioxygenase family protein [Aquisalinus luteolus]NHK27380.1 phytanoyl-CoA dioxygenase [Aquisalinus luteolus]GGH95261.1 hypothetical protein GCM10011355_11380 [Aquisalinus luteolus]
MPSLAVDGYEKLSAVIDTIQITELISQLSFEAAGCRVFEPQEKLRETVFGPMLSLVAERSTQDIRPVRIILFDKKPGRNWTLGWHQDRTIAVRERHELPEFQVWSTKGGVPHVEPPFRFMEDMLTMRLHLDDVDKTNGALEVISGSHCLGRLSDAETASAAAAGKAVAIEQSAGDAVILATPIVHRSLASTSERRRRVIHVDLSPKDLPPPLEWALS